MQCFFSHICIVFKINVVCVIEHVDAEGGGGGFSVVLNKDMFNTDSM